LYQDTYFADEGRWTIDDPQISDDANIENSESVDIIESLDSIKSCRNELTDLSPDETMSCRDSYFLEMTEAEFNSITALTQIDSVLPEPKPATPTFDILAIMEQVDMNNNESCTPSDEIEILEPERALSKKSQELLNSLSSIHLHIKPTKECNSGGRHWTQSIPS
jgi:hypothetical protein